MLTNKVILRSKLGFALLDPTIFKDVPFRIREKIIQHPNIDRMFYCVEIQGNFTIIVLRIQEKDESKTKTWAGVAKRDPNSDRPNIDRGLCIAATRAFRKFLANP